MFGHIAIATAAIAAIILGIVFIPTLWRRLQQFLIWRSDLKSIATWAERDRLEAERLELVAAIYRRWPESIEVNLEPMDPVGYEERVRIALSPMPEETLLRVYRARASAVRITLDAKRHKMQICDAKRVNLTVEVRAAERAQDGMRRRAGDRAEHAGSTRHGRREERVEGKTGNRETGRR